MHFKTLFKICWNRGPRSSVTFYARADMQTMKLRSSMTSFARAGCKLMKSTGCMIFTLDGRSTSARAWDSDPRSSVNSLARADCKTHELLGICISHSSVTFYARAEVHVLRVYARAWSPPLERGSEIRNFQIDPQAQTQLLKLQIWFFWANFSGKHLETQNTTCFKDHLWNQAQK